MPKLQFVKKHNEVAYLEKSDKGDGPKFHQIVEFLNTTHIRYALTCSPNLYESQIRMFWKTATVKTSDDGETELHATVDGIEIEFNERSIRRHLQLKDLNGIIDLPNKEILENIEKMGYDTSDGKLTFKKGCFSPQWRFFIHTLLHCLSPKKTSWDQFSSNIAVGLICLSTNRTYNFSKFIFEHMVGNVKSKTKFLMYPRFVQLLINKRRNGLVSCGKTFNTPRLKQKVFQNMTRTSELFKGDVKALFPQMLEKIGQGEGSVNETNHPNWPIIVPNSVHNTPVTNTSEIRTNNVTVVPETSSPPHINVPDADMNLHNMDADNCTGISIVHREESSDINNPSETATHKEAEHIGMDIGGVIPTQMEHVGGSVVAPITTSIEIECTDAPPPVGNTSAAGVDSRELTELTTLCNTLSTTVSALQNDLKKTKELYSRVNIKLVSKVKKLKQTVRQLKAERKGIVVDSPESSGFEDVDMGDCSNPGSQREIKNKGMQFEVKEEAHYDGFEKTNGKENDNDSFREGLVITGQGNDGQEFESNNSRHVKATSVNVGGEELTTHEIYSTNEHTCDDAEYARKIYEDDAAKLAEERRMAKLASAAISESDEMLARRMQVALTVVDADPIIKDKYLELEANTSLTVKQKCDILAAFIDRRSEEKAFNDLIKPIKKGQIQKNKTATKVTTGPKMSYMKGFIIKHDKVSRDSLKGKSYEEVKLRYEASLTRSKTFIPIGEEYIRRPIKRSKKGNEQVDLQVQGSSSHQVNNNLAVVPQYLNVDPIQSKHPIVGWEIVKERSGKAWKVIRAGGKFAVFNNLEALIKSCDRQDLDALWRLVDEKLKKGNSTDVKEQELLVEVERLYQPDATDVHWKIPCTPFIKISWKFYDSSNVHHLTTSTGAELFMLADKEYPLSVGLLGYMASTNIENQPYTEAVKELKERILCQYSRAIVK